MAGTFNFRLSAEGAEQVIAALRSVAAESQQMQQALDTMTRASPQLASANDQATASLHRTVAVMKEVNANPIGSRLFDGVTDGLRRVEGPFGEFAREFLEGGILGAGIAAGAELFRRLVNTVDELITAIPEAGDRFVTVNAQLAAATGSATLGAQAYELLADSAAKTGISVNDSAQAFIRLRAATDDLGMTTAQVASITRGVQEIGVQSGASSEQVEGFLTAMERGMMAGSLQARELRSIMTELPEGAREFASALGIGVQQLQQMAASGKLTGDAIAAGLVKMSQQADENFEKMPETIGRASGELGQAMDDFLAHLDRGLHLSQGIAAALHGAAVAIKPVDDEAALRQQIADLQQRYSTYMAGARTLQTMRPHGLTGMPGGAEDYQGEISALEAKLLDLTQARDQATGADQAGAIGRQYATQRQAADAALDKLQEEADRTVAIRKKFDAEVAAAQADFANNVIDQATLNQRLSLAKQIEDQALAKGGGSRGSSVDQGFEAAEAKVQQLATKIDSAGQQAALGFEAGNSAVVKLTENLDKLNQAADLWYSTQDREGGPLGIDPAKAAQATQDAYANFYATINNVDRAQQNVNRDFDQFFEKSVSGFENAVAQGKNLRDVLKGLEGDIAQIITKQYVTGPLMSALGQSGGFGGIFTTLLNKLLNAIETPGGVGSIDIGAGMSSPVFGSPTGGFLSGLDLGDITSAQGNVFGPHGKVALSRYAGGGIATEPHLALFGEGSTPEAFVPMADGKTIPVHLSAGANGMRAVVPLPDGRAIPASVTHAFAEGGVGSHHMLGRDLDRHLRGLTRHAGAGDADMAVHMLLRGHGVPGFAGGGAMGHDGMIRLRRYAEGGVESALGYYGAGNQATDFVVPSASHAAAGAGVHISHGGVHVSIHGSSSSPDMIGAVVALAADRANAQLLAGIERGGTLARQVGRRS